MSTTEVDVSSGRSAVGAVLAERNRRLAVTSRELPVDESTSEGSDPSSEITPGVDETPDPGDNAVAEALDMPELTEILEEHRNRKRAETAAFGKYRWLDDLLHDTTIVDPRKYGQEEFQELEQSMLQIRREKLNAIHGAIEAAVGRQKRLFQLVNEHSGDDKLAAACELARQHALAMTNHIPDAWLADRDRLDQRINALCQSPAEREATKNAAMEIPAEVREAETAMFREVIEHGSMTGMDRTHFYFDKPELSITPEQNVRLMNTMERIIQRAWRIHDSGGTVAEVESSLEHLPPEFWPPAFIRELQAWRKVERELADERVKAMFEKKDPSLLSDFRELADFAIDTLGFVAITTDLGGLDSDAGGATKGQAFIPCAWRGAPAVVEATAGWLTAIDTGFGYIDQAAEIKEAMQTLDFAPLLEEHPELVDLPNRIARAESETQSAIALAIEESANFASTSIGVANNVGWALSAMGNTGAATMASDYIPVLCAVAAGIDFAKACKALAKSCSMLGKTRDMLVEAEIQFVSGESTDGGALVNAIINERKARENQRKKKSVDVASTGATLAGEVTMASTGGTGVGAVAGLSLKVIGKSIEYGGKVYFSNVDWNIARNAKQLIKEAQAGNPIARMQIMEDCGLYAKMYIAILASEGHPLATKFVTQRGISETDLRNPAMALSVLREAMLADADQRDETTVADSRARAIAEGVAGEGTVRLADRAIDAAKSIPSTAGAATHPYRADWSPPAVPTQPRAWAQAYSTVKGIAQHEAGLAPVSDSSDDVMTGLLHCVAPLEAALGQLKDFDADTASTEVRDEVYAVVSRALDALDEAAGSVAAADPSRNEGGLHEPMARYLGQQRQILMTHRNTLNNQLFELRIKQADWNPPNEPSIESETWNATWSAAVVACHVPAADGGVGAALRAFEKASAEARGARAASNVKLERQKRIETRDRLGDAVKALNAIRSETVEFEHLVAYVMDTLKLVLAAARENDEALNGSDWGYPATKTLDAATWTGTLQEAENVGFIASADKDEGVRANLAKWEGKKDELNTTRDPVALARVRKELMGYLTKVATGALKLAKDNRDTHQELIQWFMWVFKQAGAEVGALRDATKKKVFPYAVELTRDAWEAAVDAAVTAGAVPNHKKAKKILSTTLAEIERGIRLLTSAASTPPERFAKAKELKGHLVNFQKDISTAQDLDGYTENDCMDEYLRKLRDEVARIEEGELLTEALYGKKVDFPKPTFEYSDSSWQVVKANADAAGLIKKSRNKTGFGKALDAVAASEVALEKATRQADVEKHRSALSERLRTVISIATQLKEDTQQPNLVAYFEDAIQQSTARAEEIDVAILEGVTATASTAFTEDRRLTAQAWKATLAAAEAAHAVPHHKKAEGLLLKPLGKYEDDLVTLNSESISAKNKFKKAGEVVQRLEDITQAISAVRALDGFAQNTAMNAYLNALQVLVNDELSNEGALKAILSGANAEFARFPFTWENKSGWQKVKKEADKAGLIKKSKNKTGLGDAINATVKSRNKYAAARDSAHKEIYGNELLMRLDVVARIAREMKDSTRNSNFQAYFSDAIEMCTTERAEIEEEIGQGPAA